MTGRLTAGGGQGVGVEGIIIGEKNRLIFIKQNKEIKGQEERNERRKNIPALRRL
jgi:hypothetical protein